MEDHQIIQNRNQRKMSITAMVIHFEEPLSDKVPEMTQGILLSYVQ